MKITFSVPVNAKARPHITEPLAGEVDYPLSDNVQENIEKFGEKVVNSYFLHGAKIALQSYMRSQLTTKDVDGNEVAKDVSTDELQAKADAYELGVRTVVRKSKVEKVGDQVDEMSDDELQALLARVKARKAALKENA